MREITYTYFEKNLNNAIQNIHSMREFIERERNYKNDTLATPLLLNLKLLLDNILTIKVNLDRM